jgi:putative ABC transport system permease protein
MLFYLTIGFRNLCKNHRRSMKTLLTVVIGLSACLLAQGFMSHTLWGLRESLINGGVGHIQIYRNGYLAHGQEEPYQYLISDSEAVLRELKLVPGITLCSPRLNFQGIVSSGEKSAVFMGTAGLPEEERRLNTFATLKNGAFLNADNPYEVVIGSGLARKLNVGVGDTVTLMSALKDGGVNALDLTITGIIEVQIKAYNDVVLMANLETIQGYLDQPSSVDRIIVLLNRTENLAKIESTIQKISNKLNLEYRDWKQLAGVQYTQPMMFYGVLYFLVMGIIVLVVIFSIANTLNLAMQERIREIGTIRSLGTTRLQVGQIFIAESFLIGFIGVVLGIVMGYGLSALLNGLGGIPIPPPPGQARGYTALFVPDFIQALKLGLLFLLTATIAGFYPAFRAARLRIVDALRWI